MSKDKHLSYSRLPTDGSSTPASRSSSPSNQPQSLPADEHYAYSTSLRRHEPESQAYPSSAGSGYASGHPYSAPGSSPTRDFSSHGTYSHHPFAHTTSPLTPSAHYATLTVASTVSALSTSASTGLNSQTIPAIRELSGPNEFEVAAKDPVWKRFAGQFYESPLILLLLGSAVVSAVVGNYDDAASIIVAIVIVVTGK